MTRISHFQANQSPKTRGYIQENGTVSHFGSKIPRNLGQAMQHLESIGYFGPNTRRKPVYLAMRNLWATATD